MDSSPVDEAWDEVGAAVSASDPPPSEDERPPVQVIAELHHPHLVLMQRATDGVGFEPDLASGMSLAELCRTEAGWFPLPLRVGLRILLDALSGLAAIHQATRGGSPIGFVHGEFAPPNIIVGRDGVGRLIAALPAHWTETATPSPEVTGYIAPERLLGDTFGQPADVFSAGVLLWEAVTGKPLFRNWPLDAIVTQLIGRKVPYPIPFGDALWGVPLADVAMRALSVDPAERWNHVGAFGAQIETIARGHLAAPDEIAALVAGFSAGKGRAALTTLSDATTIPPPANVATTSISPTANSIQSPAEVEPPAEVAAPMATPTPVNAVMVPPPQREWEAAPVSTAQTRIWLPTDDTHIPGSVRPASSDVADSWSGIAPSATPRRPQTVAWAAVSLGLLIAGGTAYHFLDRTPESHASSTVLASKLTSPTGSTSPAATVFMPAKPSNVDTLGGDHGDTASTQSAVAKADEVPSAAPSAMPPPTLAVPSGPAAVINRPRPAMRPAPLPPPPPSAATPPAAAPPHVPPAQPAPPPAAAPPKPKPKEDLFGI